MKRKILFLVLAVVMVLGMLPVTAFAYDFGGLTYDDNDYTKLRDFLNQPSAVSGKTNGQQINAAYNALNPDTWTGVVWNEDSTKRVIEINWIECSLAGELDVSGFSELEVIDCRDNHITALDLSATALIMLNCVGNPLTSVYVEMNGNSIELTARGYGYVSLFAMIGEAIYAHATPRSGASFINWTADGTEVSTDDEYGLNQGENHNIVANFTYSVTFDKNGGDTEANPASKAVNFGDKIEMPLPPTRAGYIFDGWYKEAACTNAWNFASDTVTDNMTLYAKWVQQAQPQPTPTAPTPPILALSMSPSNGKIFTGGRVTITPNIPGGTWQFDGEYLSRDGDAFTGLKAGSTRVTYTAGQQSAYADIVISKTELPSTGQSFMLTIVLLILALCTGGLFLALGIRQRRNERT